MKATKRQFFPRSSQETMDALVQKADTRIALAKLLIDRMAQLSADSIWARRVSGYRGTLLKLVTKLENDPIGTYSEELQRDYAYLGELIQRGFTLLEKAAREK